MEEERWKYIAGTSDMYMVSTLGRVKSLKCGREKLLKQRKDSWGYPRVGLSINGKVVTRPVHRLVAEAFIPNPDMLETVNHKDEVKDHNFVENLEWMTGADNTAYSCCTTTFVCRETGEVWHSQSECARQMGLDKRDINHVLKGRVRHTHGYSFAYC